MPSPRPWPRSCAISSTSYSEFGQRIAKALQASLHAGDPINLPSYNDLVLKVVRKQVDAQLERVLQTQLADNLAKLLQTPPEEITLEKLVDSFRDFCAGRIEPGEFGKFTLLVEQDEGPTRFAHIHIDEKPNKKKYECEYQIHVMDGTIYQLRIGRLDVEKTLFVGDFYGWEKLLFSMKVAGTKLLVDAKWELIDTHYGSER